MQTRPGVFKYSEIRGLSLSVRHSACNTDKLPWADDNNDMVDRGYTFMSTHLILVSHELVNDYLPKVYQNCHYVSVQVCVRSAFRCKLCK